MSSVSPSSYYQALQSCLEQPKLAEPRVLRLRLAPQNSIISPSSSSSSSSSSTTIGSHPEPAAESKHNAGGFSFLQCISVKETGEINRDQAFTLAPTSNHSSVIKRCVSSLSKKSLETCTESLGSETGSDDRGSDDDELLLPLSAVVAADSWSYEDRENVMKTSISTRAEARQRVRNMHRRSSGCSTLPPPLSSIGGSTGVQMRSRREDGRLVVTAVTVSPSRTRFHAERSNGRLRLHLTTEYPTQVEEAEEEKTEDDKRDKEKEETKEGELEGDEQWGEVMGDVERASSSVNRGGSGRCKEGGDGNRGLMNWEPFWVTT